MAQNVETALRDLAKQGIHLDPVTEAEFRTAFAAIVPELAPEPEPAPEPKKKAAVKPKKPSTR